MPTIFELSANLALSSNPYVTGIRTAAKATDDFVGSVSDAMEASIKLGANFESVRNSVAVFAGGVKNAEKELAALDETVRNTAGLNFNSAEDGYRNLRALGFEAETTRKLIAGLGKQKLTSGADDESVQRVIVNLTQLASGSERASQDLKEMYHAMPSLRKELAMTFGTLDPKKLAAAFGDNPQEAIKKFSEQLEKSQGAASGLNDSWGKLTDEYQLAQREFSKSVIPELTQDIKSLTSYIHENGNAWTMSGVKLANFYNALSHSKSIFDAMRNLPELLDFKNRSYGVLPQPISDEESLQKYRARNLNALSFEDYVKQQTGQTVDELKRYQLNLNNILFGGSDETTDSKRQRMNLNIGYNTMLNQKEDESLKPERENAAKQAQADVEFAIIKALDQARNNEISDLKAYFTDRQSITENSYKIEEATIKSHLDYTLEDELKTLKTVSAAKSSSLKTQISEETAYYQKLIALNAGNDTEIQKLSSERNIKIRGLNSELVVNELETQKQIAEKEKQILDRRRADAGRFYDLSIRDLKTYISSLNADFGNFSGFKDSVTAAYSDLANIVNKQYALQLQNESLSAEQRTNVIREMYSEQASLAQEQSQKLIEIESKRHDQFIQNFTNEAKRFNQYLQSQGQVFSQLLSQFFQPNINFGEGFKKFGQGILDLGIESNANEKINGVLTRKISLYEAQKSILGKTHLAEQENLRREIDLNNDLIQLETIRQRGAVNQAIANYQGKYDSLLNQRGKILQNDSTADVSGYQSQADAIQKQINDLKNTTDKELASQSPAIKSYQNQIQSLTEALKQLKLNQAGQDQNLFAQSTEGLKQLFEEIRNGSKDGIISQLTENDLWKQKVDLATEMKFLQAQIANYSQVQPLELERAKLQENLHLRELETQKIIEGNRTLMDRVRIIQADLPDSSTQMKDSFIDAIGAMSDSMATNLTTWNNGFKGVMEGIAKSFADAMQSVAQSMLRLLIYKSIMKLIGMFTGGSDSGGLQTDGFPDGGGFAVGGYTGAGAKNAVAGWVHKNEYVIPSEAVNYWGVGALESIKNMKSPQGMVGGLSSPLVSPMVSNNSTNRESHFHIQMSYTAAKGTQQEIQMSSRQMAKQVAGHLDRYMNER